MDEMSVSACLICAFFIERSRIVLSDPEYYKDTIPDPGPIWEEVFDIFTQSRKALELHQQGQNPALCDDEAP